MSLGLRELDAITAETVREEDFELIGQVEELPDKPNLNSGGVLRGITELLAAGKYKLYAWLRDVILPNRFLRTAGGDWLRLQAANVGLEAFGALTTQGTVNLSRLEAGGNLVVEAGELVGSLPDAAGISYQFRIRQAAVAADGQAELALAVEAAEPGQAYNLAAGAISELITGLAGWDSVSNPADWITREGRDEEADGRILKPGERAADGDGLRGRVGLAWRAGNRCNWAAYTAVARDAGATDALAINRRGRGAVDVIVLGPTGLPSDDLLAAVEAALLDDTTGMPATDDVAVYAPLSAPQDYELELVMLPGQAGDEAALIATAKAALAARHNPSLAVSGVAHLGLGKDNILQEVFHALKSGGLGGLKEVHFTSPDGDQALDEIELATLGNEPVVTVSEAEEA